MHSVRMVVCDVAETAVFFIDISFKSAQKYEIVIMKYYSVIL